jgi:hypothetical protein
MSDQLMALYDNATVITHTGGHFVPTMTPYKSIVDEFMKKFSE